MPSALETLVKILKLEREQGYKNTAVIGGLGAFATNWQSDAHAQARKPEHHALVDELVSLLGDYEDSARREQRHTQIKYMMDRITGRVPGPGGQQPAPTQAAPQATESSPKREKMRDRPKKRDRQPQQQDSAQRQEESPKTAKQKRQTSASKADKAQPASRPAEQDDAEPIVVQKRPKPLRKPRHKVDYAEAVERLHGLSAPVTVIDGVGEKMAEKLARLGINSVGDLLYHVPRRYDDYTRLSPIAKVTTGETLTLIGTIRGNHVFKGRGSGQHLQVTLDDGTGTLVVFFFGQPYLRSQLKRGVQLVVSGKVEQHLGKHSMNNPEWELLELDNLHTRAIVPVYPLTKGLTARTSRRIQKKTTNYWAPRLPDYMPESVLDRSKLMDLGWSLSQMHFPENWSYLEYAQERLAFDELFLLQMAMLARRRAWQEVPGVPQPVEDEWLEGVVANLPYQLTNAQQTSLSDIRADMALDVPMNRLLQGDVGSGKTIVAALAMLFAVQNSGQAVLMAPTSILAEQHYRSITTLLADLLPDRQINVQLLTGATPEAERDNILWGLGEGSVSIVIGTHALIQPDVNFSNLTLAVVDEQHRFGVSQRGLLRGKGTNPHLLVMTATPIPRTLALTLHADLDLSVIDEMPPGRMPIETHLMRPIERERAYSFIAQQVEKGRQAFMVYPLVKADVAPAGDVDESLEDSVADILVDDDNTQAAVDEYERLQREIFPELRLGLLHGRMRPDEKEATMAQMQAGEIDILVSTSVVEVGIDIPNASVMYIEGANKFGLAQLHQFRGRVGRGEYQSYCLLIGDTTTEDAQKRLDAMVRSQDGFELAEVDYQIRGAGDLFGVRQSGMGMQPRFGGHLMPPLVALAQREARTVYAEDETLALPEHRLLAERVAMWQAVETDLS